MGPAIIDDLDAARALFAPLAADRFETCGFAYLARDRRLLGMRHTPSTSFVRIEVPIRLIATDALAFDAATIVMAHNHPSGDPTPSADDLTITRRLARALDALGITLAEHLVLARGGVVSLRARGVL